MRILILGGTRFVGRHLVDVALARGHEVTLFNRGQSAPELFQEVERLYGDRDGNLTALEGGKWDAVIDTCGYVPRLVRDSAQLLADAVAHYTFISTISVYQEIKEKIRIDEMAKVGCLEDETVEEITQETYGPLKVLCEEAAEAAMPGRVLIIRPGLIVGPYDPTDRFTYWPVRVAEGGIILAPSDPRQPIQFIDARDLAKWTIQMVEAQATGIYNATGPDYPLTMQDFLLDCQEALQPDAQLRWSSEEFLLAHQVTPFTELPLWLPKESTSLMLINMQKALNAGLTFRPVAEIIRDTLAWHATRPAGLALKAGLTREREKALLAAL